MSRIQYFATIYASGIVGAYIPTAIYNPNLEIIRKNKPITRGQHAKIVFVSLIWPVLIYKGVTDNKNITKFNLPI